MSKHPTQTQQSEWERVKGAAPSGNTSPPLGSRQRVNDRPTTFKEWLQLGHLHLSEAEAIRIVSKIEPDTLLEKDKWVREALVASQSSFGGKTPSIDPINRGCNDTHISSHSASRGNRSDKKPAGPIPESYRTAREPPIDFHCSSKRETRNPESGKSDSHSLFGENVKGLSRSSFDAFVRQNRIEVTVDPVNSKSRSKRKKSHHEDPRSVREPSNAPPHDTCQNRHYKRNPSEYINSIINMYADPIDAVTAVDSKSRCKSQKPHAEVLDKDERFTRGSSKTPLGNTPQREIKADSRVPPRKSYQSTYPDNTPPELSRGPEWLGDWEDGVSPTHSLYRKSNIESTSTVKAPPPHKQESQDSEYDADSPDFEIRPPSAATEKWVLEQWKIFLDRENDGRPWEDPFSNPESKKPHLQPRYKDVESTREPSLTCFDSISQVGYRSNSRR